MESNKLNRNNFKKQIVKITVSAMLIGISVVIGAVCREYLTFGTFVRITFENLPIILSAILFGPAYGIVVGLCADLIPSVITGQDINPIITAGAMCVGMVAGLTSKILSKIKMNDKIKITISCVLAHILGCMIIKTLGLKLYYFPNNSFWYLFGIRFAVYTVISAAETFFLFFILKNNYIKGFSDHEL
jgi:ECF transporter S component (folate family)